MLKNDFVDFYGISIIIGYLKENPVLFYMYIKYMICKNIL